MENKLVLCFSSIIFFLLPWYYMQSGLPQPVDLAIFFVLVVFVILKVPYLNIISASIIYRLFLYLILYSLIVLLINDITQYSDITSNFIAQNIYYFLLISMFLFIFIRLQHIYGMKKCYNISLYFSLFSCVLPVCFWMSHGESVSLERASLTFNNPNQLGFFALVNISIVYYFGLLARDSNIKLNKWLAISIININLAFLFLSTSRACYPVFLLYVLCYFIFFNFKVKRNAIWLYRITSVGIALFACLMLFSKAYYYMKTVRLSNLTTNYDGIMFDFYFRALRGMDFELMNVSHLIIGSGNYTTLSRGLLEFHNNFIAIFYQIGLLGLLFYLYINFVVFWELLKKGYLYLMPFCCYLFYSMFQYSFRTRLNWLFISVIIFTTITHRLYSSRRNDYEHLNHHDHV